MKESYVKVPLDILNSMLILIQKAKHDAYSFSDIQDLLNKVSKLDVVDLPDIDSESSGAD